MRIIRILIISIFSLLSVCGNSQNFFWSHTPTKICFGFIYNGNAVDLSLGDTITSSDDWRVPSGTDFKNLADSLGAAGDYISNSIGGKMKETGFIFWESPNTGATNSSGFNGIASGQRLFNGNFTGDFTNASYLTDGNNVGTLYYNDAVFQVVIGGAVATTGRSIRLVKDAVGVSNGTTTTYVGNDTKTYEAIAIGELYWLTENLEETKWRDNTYIEGYNSGTYTPINNSTWSALSVGALCLYNDDLMKQCK